MHAIARNIGFALVIAGGVSKASHNPEDFARCFGSAVKILSSRRGGVPSKREEDLKADKQQNSRTKVGESPENERFVMEQIHTVHKFIDQLDIPNKDFHKRNFNFDVINQPEEAWKLDKLMNDLARCDKYSDLSNISKSRIIQTSTMIRLLMEPEMKLTITRRESEPKKLHFHFGGDSDPYYHLEVDCSNRNVVGLSNLSKNKTNFSLLKAVIDLVRD